jgi:hypothetical protein
MNQQQREDMVAAALQAHDPVKHGTRQLPWREGSERFPVVEISVDAVLLNPRSHRIRAQLESTPGAEAVERDPWSDEAQALIATILRGLGESFEELKTNLEEEGQLEEGVITRFGLLVNANRRAVALRDLGRGYVQVAVLPSDASEEEIDGLELRLQMQKDFREPYTFTNRLLFVDELITRQNRTVDQVARALNIAASSDARELAKGRSKVEQDTRVLSMIRQVQARSTGRLPLTSFDEQEIALEELDTRLKDLATQDPDGAARLQEVRLLGLLSDVPYRDLRHLDGDSLEAHVLPLLADDDLLGDIVEHLQGVEDGEKADEAPLDGLDVLDDESRTTPAPSTVKVRALNDLLASTHGSEVLLVEGSEGPRRVDRKPVVDAVCKSLRAAAQEIRQSDRKEDRLQVPANRLAEAERKVQVAGDAYPEVSGETEFDRDGFSARLNGVLRRLRSLAETADVELED